MASLLSESFDTILCKISALLTLSPQITASLRENLIRGGVTDETIAVSLPQYSSQLGAGPHVHFLGMDEMIAMGIMTYPLETRLNTLHQLLSWLTASES